MKRKEKLNTREARWKLLKAVSLQSKFFFIGVGGLFVRAAINAIYRGSYDEFSELSFLLVSTFSETNIFFYGKERGYGENVMEWEERWYPLIPIVV